MPRGCQVVRVFTIDGEGGNLLGVVNDVSGLSADAMQRIAAELGFSETVFADWRDDSRPPQLRIFTPAAEIAFAGHPLVGTAWVYTHLGPGGPGTLECPSGTVSYRQDGELMWVRAPVPVHPVEAGDVPALVARCGYPTPVRAWRVMMPSEYLLAEVGAHEAVSSVEPDLAPLEGADLYVFRRDEDHVHARFFAPEFGITEDPATGSAAVALAHALMADGETRGSLTIRQGSEMGSPSLIELTWEDGVASIGGAVVPDGVRFLDL